MTEPEPTEPDTDPGPLPIEAEAQQAANTPAPPPPVEPQPVGDKSDLVAQAMRKNRGLASYDAWAMTETDLTKLLEG